MNQADSENKCSKRVSYECILDNLNVDDVSNDQSRVCEYCKQRGWSVCGKHSVNVGSVYNKEHVVGVAEVYPGQAKSQQQQQPGTSHPCQQSLLRKVWGHLQSIITAHMNGCPRCNSKSPFRPAVQSVSQSSVQSFLSPTASPSTLSCKQSCLSCKTSCHKPSAPCLNARPSCTRTESASLRARSFCPIATSSFQKNISSFSRASPTCPNVTPPCSSFEKTSCVANPPNPKLIAIGRNAKQSFTFTHCPYTKVSTLKNKLICSNAKCPNAKSSCENKECPNSKPACGNAECPNSKPSCPRDENAKTSCSNAECPNAKKSNLNLEWPNDKPFSPNSECPNAKPSCPIAEYSNAKPFSGKVEWHNAKPSYENAEYPDAKPSCPNSECPNVKPLSVIAKPSSHMAKPSCPSAVSVCPNSKTKLYHSFSNDSLSSICKEDLVQLTKAYLQKITSSHKMRCPRCSKQPTFPSPIETITTYLRNMLEQAWSYFDTTMSSSNKICHPQCALSSSNIAKKSSCPVKSRCCCATPQPKCQKTESFESLCFPKPDICPTRPTPATGIKPSVLCPRVNCPTSFKPATCIKPASCPKYLEYEDITLPARKSEEQGTHEHKSCCTPCCKHNSQAVQPSFIFSDTSVWSSVNSRKPPQLVEELKASITGTTGLDKSSGKLLGCEILDFRSTINKNSQPRVQDLKFPKDSISLTDKPTTNLDLSLNKEQKDHGYNSHLKDCKQTKEFLDNCENSMNPCIDLEERNGKDEAGGYLNSDAHYEAIIDEEFRSMPSPQQCIKAPISKASPNSITCVDSIQPDCKDYNSREKDAHGKDPHNYRYYY